MTLDDWYQTQAEGIPLERYGESDEAGAVIAFLASKHAGYITGAAINLDGGLSAVV
jgi:NAD(P)-dependent dehydrogenase (short-subunit alcohol dehydrogenase family)